MSTYVGALEGDEVLGNDRIDVRSGANRRRDPLAPVIRRMPRRRGRCLPRGDVRGLLHSER